MGMKCAFRVRRIKNEEGFEDYFKECLGFGCPAFHPVGMTSDDKNSDIKESENSEYEQECTLKGHLSCLRLYPRT